HTSFSRDWSSDVCSSDLGARSFAGPDVDGVLADAAALLEPVLDGGAEVDAAIEARDASLVGGVPEAGVGPRLQPVALAGLVVIRSEERRVGKHAKPGGSR